MTQQPEMGTLLICCRVQSTQHMQCVTSPAKMMPFLQTNVLWGENGAWGRTDFRAPSEAPFVDVTQTQKHSCIKCSKRQCTAKKAWAAIYSVENTLHDCPCEWVHKKHRKNQGSVNTKLT